MVPVVGRARKRSHGSSPAALLFAPPAFPLEAHIHRIDDAATIPISIPSRVTDTGADSGLGGAADAPDHAPQDACVVALEPAADSPDVERGTAHGWDHRGAEGRLDAEERWTEKGRWRIGVWSIGGRCTEGDGGGSKERVNAESARDGGGSRGGHCGRGGEGDALELTGDTGRYARCAGCALVRGLHLLLLIRKSVFFFEQLAEYVALVARNGCCFRRGRVQCVGYGRMLVGREVGWVREGREGWR
jgi:hypothetical protein